MYRNVLSAALALVLICALNAFVQADLIGYWPMEGDANDQTSNGIDGELFGDVAFVDDVPEALGGWTVPAAQYGVHVGRWSSRS